MRNTHYLSSMFEPASVAVIGASEGAQSVGAVIFSNLVDGGFRGALHAVNPKHETVMGRKCHRSVEEIGARVELAIIATPARTLHAVVEQCARAGVSNAVLVTALERGDRALEQRVLDTARAARVRLLGPGSLGILRPQTGLYAALSRIAVASGELALVTQSGAMCSVVLDWAATHQIGFSSVISLSTAIDVDFGETLDYLAHDERTRYILLHVDHVRNARRFMSALRSAARIKPIILFKTGRHEQRGVHGEATVGEASLAELNQRLAAAGHAAVGIERFRPNIVLAGLQAHDEDRLHELRIATAEGEVVLRLVKPCPRCPIPNVDPATGENSPEVLQALSAYRADARLDGALAFGMNAVIVQGAGHPLCVGDAVRADWRFD